MVKKGKRKLPRKIAYKENPSQPRKTYQEQQPSSDQNKPVWRFSILDWDGPWGWRNVDANRWQEILQKLGFFETRTWADIKSDGNNHAVKIKNSPNLEAPKRLAEIHLDDIEELFYLRFSGKERIWGILDGHILKILWWDTDHDVWPSTKKHT